MSTKKRYTDVSELVRDLSEDQAATAALEQRLAQRQIVKQLMALRAVAGMSQKDIANKLNCTQSRISKLESGTDADLRFADFFGYAAALGLEAHIVVSKKGRTTVDEVKYHAFAIKRQLDHLAHLAMGDETIAAGVTRFFGEAAFNLINMLNDAATKLPQQPRPLIEIIEVGQLTEDDHQRAGHKEPAPGCELAPPSRPTEDRRTGQGQRHRRRSIGNTAQTGAVDAPCPCPHDGLSSPI
jgi:transcriptional regulator with XRE-family HTH domain